MPSTGNNCVTGDSRLIELRRQRSADPGGTTATQALLHRRAGRAHGGGDLPIAETGFELEPQNLADLARRQPRLRHRRSPSRVERPEGNGSSHALTPAARLRKAGPACVKRRPALPRNRGPAWCEVRILDHGEIAERGSHASLLKHSGIYAALWRAQQRGHCSSDEEVVSAA